MRKVKEINILWIIGIIVGIYHIFMKLDFGDDIYYLNLALDKNTSILKYWFDRYYGWSSRIIIETVLIIVIKFSLLWRIIDTFIWVFIVYMIQRILNIEKIEERHWLLFLFMLYPFFDMAGAGWITTTVTYIWPLFCVLFVGVIIIKLKEDKKVTIGEYIFSVISILFATNHEQVVVMVLMILCFAVVWFYINKKKGILFLIVELMLALGEFIFILCVPGNYVRKIVSIESYFSGFSDLSIIDKVYLGMLRVEKIFVAEPNSIFFIFCIIVFLVVWKKYSSIKNIIIASIPLIILSGYAILCQFFPNYRVLFFIPEELQKIDYTSIKTYVPFLFITIIVICILFSLFQVMKNEMGKFLFCCDILAAGFATNVMMGFSPTIYISGKRTSLFLYFSLIFTGIYIIHENKEVFQFSDSKQKYINIIMFVWGFFSIFNTFSCIVYTIFT